MEAGQPGRIPLPLPFPQPPHCQRGRSQKSYSVLRRKKHLFFGIPCASPALNVYEDQRTTRALAGVLTGNHEACASRGLLFFLIRILRALGMKFLHSHSGHPTILENVSVPSLMPRRFMTRIFRILSLVRSVAHEQDRLERGRRQSLPRPLLSAEEEDVCQAH